MTKYPSRLKIEHTNICNGQCIMCSHFFSDNANAKMADDALLERVAPLLPFVRRILLEGSGEPFAHPRIARYINYYAGMGLEVTCNTNLSILSADLIAAIHRGFRKINVSCDGCTAEIYEGIRRNLRFDLFSENLRYLRRECPGLIINMYTVAMRQNIAQLPDIVRFASGMGCDSITITDLSPKRILENEKDMLKHYPSVTMKFLTEALDIASELSLKILHPSYLLGLEKISGFDEETRRMESIQKFPNEVFQRRLREFYRTQTAAPAVADWHVFSRESGLRCRGICNYLTDEPYIDLRGDVYPCPAGRQKVGNVYAEDILSIWDNANYQGLRELFYTGKLPMYCEDCLYLRNHYLGDVEILGS